MPVLARLFDAMWIASVGQNGGNSLYLDGLTLQFLAIVADAEALSPVVPDRPEDFRIAQALDYIEAYLGTALTIAELAAIAHLFKEVKGKTPMQFMMSYRIEQSQRTIEDEAAPLGQIALD